MKGFSLLFGLILICCFSFGQVSDRQNYIYLFSDSIINGRDFSYEKPYFGNYYLKVDSKRIDLANVKFFKVDTLFFANTKMFSISETSSFAVRIRKGKINLFEKITNVYSMNGGGYTRENYYYNKGFGDLKKANYNNLVVDLSSNSESLFWLNKYNSFRKTEITLYSVGTVLFVSGLISLINKTKDVNYDTDPHPNLTGNAIVMGGGVVCGIIGTTFTFGKSKFIKKAVERYNK